MSKRGDELIASARQALAWVRGEDMPGMAVHEPAPAIDVRAVRHRTGLTRPSSRAGFASRSGPAHLGAGYPHPAGGPTRALLRVIDAKPEAALRALGKAA